jgi:putative ABC transport system permease protein
VRPLNPKILGIRLSMLLYLYRRRLRAHPAGELLAGAGVAIGVALVFGVLLANASLTGAAGKLIHGLAGSARYALVGRSAQGFDERTAEAAGRLPGVQVAAPVLRENVTLRSPRGAEAVQLIGVTPSLEALGGIPAQELEAGGALLQGGLGLPAGVARALGVHAGQRVAVASDGAVHSVQVRAVLGAGGGASIADSPVAVAVLEVAQALAGRPGRVSEVLIRPLPGQERAAAGELARLAGSRLDVRPADDELRLLSEATKPNRQSTSLFSAIAVMIGFLLALNAILLTVPERRRFIAELRMQGYDPRQILLLLGSQAVALGVVASLIGVVLGDLLSHAFFQRVPGFLTAAFPIGTAETVHAGTVALAIGCGVLATALATLAPLLDLRSGRAADAALGGGAARSEIVQQRTIARLGLAGVALIAAALAIALLDPALTIAGGVALALATLCLIPAAFAAAAHWLPRASERIRSSALIVALAELRATTTRSVALAGIVGLAVYGGIAIGGARHDLLRGIERATTQYFATADVWVTSGRDVFNTNNFAAAGPAAALAHASGAASNGASGVASGAAAGLASGSVPGVASGAASRGVSGAASVRIYRGGLLDVGERRMWVRARPPGDPAMLEASQLLAGDYARATARIRAGGWAAVSREFAEERGLAVGSALSLPTPSGPERVRIAAITTNSGWPAGALTLNARDYSRWFGSADAAALEVSLPPGVSPAQGRRAVRAALAGYPGLTVHTAAERVALSETSARQGLRTLEEISTLLLLAAALAVASALSAAIWQRRARLAALKIQGYDAAQLWRAVLLESAITIAIGSAVGAVVGVCGHALASRFLERTTGFPAPFSVGPEQVLLTLALIAAIALAVIALPGLAAARVPPRAVLQD